MGENGSKDILMLVVDLIDVLKDDDILEEVVALINRIQGMAAIKGENIVKHIERGEMGPAPDTDLLCETYIHRTVTENKSKANKREINTVWTKKNNMFYMGEWCPLTGYWFLSKIATCGCTKQMCFN